MQLDQTTRIYRLDPIDPIDPRWAASSFRVGCWVRASSSDEARQNVAMLTTRPSNVATDTSGSPWLSSELANCHADDCDIDVPVGVVVVAINGRSIG